MERKFDGIPGSPGVAIDPAVIVGRSDPDPAPAGAAADPSDPSQERERLNEAIAAARDEITALEADVRRDAGDEAADVFGAHLLMLDDPELIDRIESAIAEGAGAEEAVLTSGKDVAALLESLDDPYMRERAADVIDVTQRIHRHLTGGGGDPDVPQLTEPAVLIARQLLPSETARIDRRLVRGVVTAEGGATSHAVLLARALGIPAAVGLGDELLAFVKDGDPVIVDGEAGSVIVHPEEETVAVYERKLAERVALRSEAAARLRDEPAMTADGHRFRLMANITEPDEAGEAREGGAEGVGLFRTEFLYMGRPEPPSEDEQRDVYRRAADAMAPHPVVIRTLDAGGDKPIPYLQFPEEENPFLGLRGVRFSLAEGELLRQQLRALWRAAPHGRIQIMVPMVTEVAEVEQVRAMLESCRDELVAEDVPIGDVELGIMIETPAAALDADRLAARVDFFSIGSNDLTQYTLAVDRGNRAVSQLYQELHPAVLRLMKMTVEAAARHDIPVGVCGEMASNPEAAAILIGLGVTSLSVNVPALLDVKAHLRSLSLDDCRKAAQDALGM